MRGSVFAVAVLIGIAVGNACLLDLDHQLACGDGYVDGAAGEECDPAKEDSYINACIDTTRPTGDGACDPETCTIINDRVQCATCGDGLRDADAGEECDGNVNIPGQCPTSGPVACTSDCKIDFSKCELCGNGVVDMDAGEECEPSEGGGIGIARECDTLKSPYQDQPYSSGTAINCLPDCKYDRTECGYCGNGKLETNGALVSLPSQPSTMSRPEKCDGENFDLDELAQEYPCSTPTIGNVECSDNCLDFVPRDNGAPCCLPRGAPCPEDDTLPRCCHEFAEPDVEEHCSDPFAPPGKEPPEPGGGNSCN
jgi:hypothetical protein